VSHLVYIGLGSNEGDREQHLCTAVDAVRRIDAVAVLRRSDLFDSAPVGPPQPRYLNAVIELECALPPQRLLAILKHIEGELGRQKSHRWGPRPIDLDILLWDGEVIADANLQVPHLEMHKRRFVLEPLVELVPELRHPVLGASLQELLRHLEPQDVVRHAGESWVSDPLNLNDTLESGT
jgi:2-amino-4-hydroxy-6-hydroxymethyldihydropteridine diphosphokinase